jgi:hypothetical protein
MSDSWGWSNVEPQKWDFDKLRKTIKDFESALSEREYPDEYACEKSVWDKICETAKRTHSQGIGNSTLEQVCGIPVRVFESTSECVDYITASKINGKRVQLLR